MSSGDSEACVVAKTGIDDLPASQSHRDRDCLDERSAGHGAAAHASGSVGNDDDQLA
ncbi:MAG: hypothetical protein JWO86_2390 [Myxococcaceae bacterium]|nr:hypothetical protein [Myxococcaceae bacterium]